MWTVARHQLVIDYYRELLLFIVIAKCLSSIGGTACFDKSPQSQSRGITLDLGFSTFKLSEEEHVTLVDCPGHASLIRTVVCGAQIIDLIVLVIDGTKGIQAQTAECLILSEIMTERLLFLVNKIDLWPEEERQSKFENIKTKLKSAMKHGKFFDSPIVPFSTILNQGIEEIKIEIKSLLLLKPVKRNVEAGFVFAVDHCFPIKGQGTVFTGTVLQGRISVNDAIEIPPLQVKKIKSIQRFRESVKEIEAGDRAGICVAQSSTIDSECIERTLISSSKHSIPSRKLILLRAKRVKWFNGELKSKSKMHVSILNEVVLCKQLIFVRPTSFGYEYLERIAEDSVEFHVIIELERAIKVLHDSIVIVSKFDSDPSLQRCRIAFHGRWQQDEEPKEKLTDFLIYKSKERFSLIDRVVDDFRVIGKGLGTQTQVQTTTKSAAKFIGMKIAIYKKVSSENPIFNKESNEIAIFHGKIDSLFGASGKFNVTLSDKVEFGDSFKSFVMKLTFGKVLFKENADEKEIFCIS